MKAVETKRVRLGEVFAMTQAGWEFLRMPCGKGRYLRSPEGQIWVVVRTVPGGCELVRDETREMKD